MPFSATVMNVLIASPSDVPEERTTIAQSLHEWNSLHSATQGIILLPVMWETHSAPAMGDRPQGLINDRVVRGCDMLIGSFWTKIGSPTGVEISGTVEEIKWFLTQKKPVMLYYSKKSVDLDTVDLEQVKKLKEFKASIRDKGIQDDYRDLQELKEKLSRHLTIVLRDMSIAPVIDKRIVEAAKASTRDDGDDTQRRRAVNRVRLPAKDDVYLEKSTPKSFIIRGSTSGLKNQIEAEGGKFISLQSGGKAWMFSNSHLNAVAKILDIEPIVREKSE
ncbi:hypothetical protein OIU34_00040 [Pararhizobium sp. BT-229]|uniref:hypothetical protein n=1 Tax=Pararhizobium sp. BT-229 TaxID=2986923 RepID=UPI0021F78FA8|nr:hypothetical protein [Pararhizobium sp. BT-229]MCV9960277.1 hypothetical protein [Pararhizobium sp. BT-229]